MGRYLNVLLIIAIMVGAGLFLRRQQMLSKAREQHKYLADKVGVLGVEDPGKFQVLRVDTGDPTHFLWRVYYPKSVHLATRFKNRSGQGSTSTSQSNAGEMLIRVRFEISPDALEIHRMSGGAGGLSKTIGSPAYMRFLNEHWQDLDIQVVDAVTFDAEKKVDLLKISLTDELRNSLKGSQDRVLKGMSKELEPLYAMQFGSDDAIEAAQKAAREKRKLAESGVYNNGQ